MRKKATKILISVFLIVLVLGYLAYRNGVFLVVEKTVPESDILLVEAGDSNGYFSIFVPESWTADRDDSPKGMLSQSVWKSRALGVGIVGNEAYQVEIKNGAFVAVSVYEGQEEGKKAPDAENVESSESLVVAGSNAVHYKLKEKIIGYGNYSETRFVSGELSYVIRFGYDPDYYSNGDELIRRILMTLQIKKS